MREDTAGVHRRIGRALLNKGRAIYNEMYYFQPDGHFIGHRGSRGGDDSKITKGYNPGGMKITALPAFGQWEPFVSAEWKPA